MIRVEILAQCRKCCDVFNVDVLVDKEGYTYLQYAPRCELIRNILIHKPYGYEGKKWIYGNVCGGEVKFIPLSKELTSYGTDTVSTGIKTLRGWSREGRI